MDEISIVSELMKDEVFEFPKHTTRKYFPRYLNEKFAAYIEKIQQISILTSKFSKEEIERQKLICQNLVECVELHLSGFYSRAFVKFSEGMSLSAPFVISNFPQYLFYDAKDLISEICYRARPLEVRKKFQKKDLFHVPFEKRHRVSSCRFSIPGFPCLYLSSDPYTCWYELGKSKSGKMAFSRLEPNDVQLKFVDLTLYSSTDLIRVLNQDGIRDLEDNHVIYKSFLERWPLILACSVPSHRKDSFKVEYTVPQMVMEWVRSSKKADGVKYFTTKNFFKHNSIGYKFVNYAIPVQIMSEFGYCSRLANLFKITDPLVVDAFTFKTEHYHRANISKGLKMMDEKVVPATEFVTRGLSKISLYGKKIFYRDSTFMEIELELLNRKASPL